LEEMLDAVLSGTRAEGVEGVDVISRPALAATASDVLSADGFVLGTPANMGYMSGALKHFFDQVYYPCLTARAGAPYGLFVHGNLDVTGAQRSVVGIVTGMGWRRAAADVTVVGTPSRADLEACWELGAVVAASVAD
jgi:multimeric flavodoxin WrbA